jgi:diacylglycerol kinase (ATP)
MSDPAERSIASPYKGRRGLQRIWNALFYSLDGFRAAFKHEAAFRQEVLIAGVLIPVALMTGAGAAAKAIMISSVLLVLIVELLNSGIEAVTDRISLEDHALAKRAKDLGSAAVMLSLIDVPVVWAVAPPQRLGEPGQWSPGRRTGVKSRSVGPVPAQSARTP